jgi:periplasmic copper chaperone A
MKTAFARTVIVSAAVTAAVLLVGGGIASAHIDPDPIAMQAGTSATVAFNVEHGCDGSPTTSMKFQVPADVTDAVAVAKDGWTSMLTGDILEFKGGPLAADQKDHFDITFTAPAQPGDIRFPVIQSCEQGELAWIEEAPEGAPEPEHPAPTIKVTAGPPTAAELTPAPEATDSETDGTSVAPGDTAVPVIATTATIAPADNSSNTGTIIVVVVVVVAVVLIGGGLLLARRRNTRPSS